MPGDAPANRDRRREGNRGGERENPLDGLIREVEGRPWRPTKASREESERMREELERRKEELMRAWRRRHGG